MRLFVPFLRKLVKVGRLTVVDADGTPHVFEGRPASGLRPSTIRLNDRQLHWRLAVQPALAAGEGYMDGGLTIEDGTLYDFLALAGENIQRASDAAPPLTGVYGWLRRLQQWNPASISRRNVEHHYDLTEAFFKLFLDSDRQYSCAYFNRPGLTLEEAQLAKKRHIMAKLLLERGQTVLDIGSGWGGLALTMAREAGVDVTGVTLSREQYAVAQQRAMEAQLEQKVRFKLMDYRHVKGPFDRIVSIGMFEHVGINHYRTFFKRVRELLCENGVALIHAIGRTSGPGITNPWIRKYIFPGGYSPALSEVLPAVENAGLVVTDVEVLRSHYADTLRQWSERFARRRDQAVALYNESFCRMWEFYLAGAEVAFRHMDHMVWQLQVSVGRDAVPHTRDYIYEVERSYPRS
jgi:cyclopropane-fatty-acyl-phospholipid synthase